MSETLQPPVQDIENLKLQLEQSLQFDNEGAPIELEVGIQQVRYDALLDEEQFQKTTAVLAAIPSTYPYREALQTSIDEKPSVLDAPYPPGYDKNTPHKRDSDFEDLVVSAVNIARDTSNPYQANALEIVRKKLGQALRADPSKIGTVLRITGLLEANASAATATMDETARELQADDWAVGSRDKHRQEDLSLPPEIDESKHTIFGLPKYTLRFDAPHDKNMFGIQRPRVHKTVDIDRSRRADEVDLVRDREFEYQKAVASREKTNTRFQKQTGYATEDNNSAAALAWLLSEIGYNSNSNFGQEIEQEYSPVGVHAHFLAEDLSNWRNSENKYSFDTLEEYKTFADLGKLSRLVAVVDTKLRGLATFDPSYSKLVEMRSDATKLYVSGLYRQTQLRIERNLVSDEGFRGRFGAHYHSDKGIEIEDGWGVVLYPDGSYAEATSPDGSKNRRNSDGTLWTEPQPAPIVTANSTEAQDLATAPYDEYLKAQNEWFLHQDPASAREFEKQARKIRDWNLEVAEQDPTNLAARQRGNVAAYWAGYMRTESAPDEADLAPNGIITYKEAHFYGHTGSWSVGPNGAMELFVINKVNGQEYKRTLASYAPDGTQL